MVMEDPAERLAAINAWRDEHWDEVLEDIAALVAVESVEDLEEAAPGMPFGPGPRAALDRALTIAQARGFQTEDCEGYLGYAELVGEGPEQIGIIGHVDVVGAGSGWHTDPFTMSIRDGYLLGRGVLDDKGPLVVALHAARAMAELRDDLPRTIRILIGCDEETAMDDVEYYREHYGDPAFLFTPDGQFPLGYGEAGILIGILKSAPLPNGEILEISGGQAPNAVPGQARARVRTERELSEAEAIILTKNDDGTTTIEAQGVSAHASRPTHGVNAIGILVAYLWEEGVGTEEERRFLELLRKLFADTDGSALGIHAADEHFGTLTCTGGMIAKEGKRITQSVDVRYPTTTSASVIDGVLGEEAERIGATFTIMQNKDPFLMDPDSAAIRGLMEAFGQVMGEGRQPVTSKGGTYARCFPRAVSFGAEKPWEADEPWVGSMHGADEGVRESLLKDAFSVYALALWNLMDCDLSQG